MIWNFRSFFVKDFLSCRLVLTFVRNGCIMDIMDIFVRRVFFAKKDRVPKGNLL